MTLDVSGEPRPLPTALDLSAYRIVQEALTNMVKHAHATRATSASRTPMSTSTSACRTTAVGAPMSLDVGTRPARHPGTGPPARRHPRRRDVRRWVHRQRPSADRMIRVMVVDDQALVRAGFTAILDGEADIEVVAEVRGRRLRSAPPRVAPDVVLMDIRMPGTDGIRATRELPSELRPWDPCADADHLRPRRVPLRGHEAGASGFLLKDAPRAQLLTAVRVSRCRRRHALPDAWCVGSTTSSARPHPNDDDPHPGVRRY